MATNRIRIIEPQDPACRMCGCAAKEVAEVVRTDEYSGHVRRRLVPICRDCLAGFETMFKS